MGLVEMRPKAELSDHFIDLQGQIANYRAKNHHAVPAVAVYGSVGLNQSPETRDSKSPIRQNPFRHTDVLFQLAAARGSPSEQTFKLVGVNAHIQASALRCDQTHPVCWQQLPQ